MREFDLILENRVRIWPAYDRALVRRGRITSWLDEQAVSSRRRQGRLEDRARPTIHGDTAVECALVAKAIFHLSLRATQGLLESAVRLREVSTSIRPGCHRALSGSATAARWTGGCSPAARCSKVCAAAGGRHRCADRTRARPTIWRPASCSSPPPRRNAPLRARSAFRRTSPSSPAGRSDRRS